MASTASYFDNNATTPLLPSVEAVIKKALKLYGNPSSLHREGRKSKEALEHARTQIAASIGASDHQIVFTSSGSEANNQLLNHMLYLKHGLKEPVHVVVSAIEHASLRTTAQQLKRFGIDVTLIPPTPSGQITPERVKVALQPHTRLVSVMLANNETGIINPISDIAILVRKQGAYMHTDAVQGYGKIPVDVEELGVDFMTVSGHKIYAPKGIGALFLRDDHTLTALIKGSVHERGLRSGTENLIGAIAMGEAAEQLSISHYQKTIAPLRDLILSCISTLPGAHLFSHVEQSVPNTICVAFDGVEGHALAIKLDLHGFAVSTGPACSVGSVEPSPILEAMGVPESRNKGMIRISLGRFNTEKGTQAFCQALKTCVLELKSL